MTGSGAWAQESTGEVSFVVDTNSFPSDQDIMAAAKYDDLIGSAEYTFYFDGQADGIVLLLPYVTEDNWIIPGIAEPGSTVSISVDGQRVTNIKRDGFTVFVAKKSQLREGQEIQITASDLSNNLATKSVTVQKSPIDGVQKLDAYAMGATHTNAHTNHENPSWLMAGLYTEEELTDGVNVPLVAACVFYIGDAHLKLENGEITCKFEPAEGVTLSNESITFYKTPSKAFSMTAFENAKNETKKDNGEAEDDGKHYYGYWVSAFAEAEVPVSMLMNSYYLDDSQKDVKDFYFSRQWKRPMK